VLGLVLERHGGLIERWLSAEGWYERAVELWMVDLLGEAVKGNCLEVEECERMGACLEK
jgi:hypothetical protein